MHAVLPIPQYRKNCPHEITFSIPILTENTLKRKGMNMKRRQKGMGSIIKLGGQRRKPYMATINKVCYGTYKTVKECEKMLLSTVLKQEDMFPELVKGNDKLEKEYIEFIVELQDKGMLSTSVFEFPSMDLFNDTFKNRLVASGTAIQQKNNSPVIIEQLPTFGEIWETEKERLKPLRSKAWEYSMASAFKHLSQIKDFNIALVKTKELQGCFDKQMNVGSGETKLMIMKNLCKVVFAHALKMEYVEKDYSNFIDYHATNDKKQNRKIFTNEEILKLINDDTDDSKIILIYIFTGMRPSELLSIPIEDIHIKENYMVGGMKTKAGIGRTVPLHNQILPYVKDFLERDNDYLYLLFPTDARLSYQNYREIFHRTMNRLELDHEEPYDTRHTFSTIAKLNGVEPTVRKKIMGHTCRDITEDVYTHEPLQYLLKEINKIKIC